MHDLNLSLHKSTFPQELLQGQITIAVDKKGDKAG